MSLALILSWLVGVVYVAAFLTLTVRIGRRSGRRIWLFGTPDQTLPAWGFRLVFVALVLAPLWGRGWSDSVIWPLLAAVGAGLALYAQGYMGLSWRIGAVRGALGPLVDTGPFAWSRNPVFVGQMAMVVMLIPAVGWTMLGVAILQIVSMRAQVRIEEAALADMPGWPAYASRVPRWLALPGWGGAGA